eukprot:274422_1
MSTREEKANLTVNGYIKQCSSTFIPTDIIDLCISFYFNNMVFLTEESLHGEDLCFMDDDKTVILMEDSEGTCLFGIPITDEICDKFRINYKWLKISEMPAGVQRFMMGFITSSIHESIGNFNQRLGLYSNRDYSRGIFCGWDYANFYVYEDNAHKRLNNYRSNPHPKEGDKFGLEINFETNKCSIYHNDEFAESISLNNVKTVMLALTLLYNKQTIEVDNWTFYKGDKMWT